MQEAGARSGQQQTHELTRHAQTSRTQYFIIKTKNGHKQNKQNEVARDTNRTPNQSRPALALALTLINFGILNLIENSLPATFAQAALFYSSNLCSRARRHRHPSVIEEVIKHRGGCGCKQGAAARAAQHREGTPRSSGEQSPRHAAAHAAATPSHPPTQ